MGQIALHIAQNHELDQWSPDITLELIRVIQAPHYPVALARNAGLTLGRLACSSPIAVAQSVPPIFGQWCRVLESAPNDHEKIYAFNGLSKGNRLMSRILTNPYLLRASKC